MQYLKVVTLREVLFNPQGTHERTVITNQAALVVPKLLWTNFISSIFSPPLVYDFITFNSRVRKSWYDKQHLKQKQFDYFYDNCVKKFICEESNEDLQPVIFWFLTNSKLNGRKFHNGANWIRTHVTKSVKKLLGIFSCCLKQNNLKGICCAEVLHSVFGSLFKCRNNI